MPIADCTISSRSSIRNFPQFSLSPNMALLNPWRHVTSVDLVMPYSEIILDDINVGLYPIHEPDGCLEFSFVLLSSSLAILVRQQHWVQKHNLLCQNFGQWLTLKSSSYQRCMSKRYHYKDETQMQFVDYVNFFSATVLSFSGKNAKSHFFRDFFWICI